MEISRVLKDEGMACIIAPSGGVEHRYPLNCWRFYPDGFKALAKYSGLNKLKYILNGIKKIILITILYGKTLY